MIELTVNGTNYEVDVVPQMPLLWVLRDELGITSPKYGCGIAQCGACIFDTAKKMLLVGSQMGSKARLWVSVISANQLAAFVGFEQCKLINVPIEATLVAGTINRFNTIVRALKRNVVPKPIPSQSKPTDISSSTTELFHKRLASKRPFEGLTVKTLQHKLESDAV